MMSQSECKHLHLPAISNCLSPGDKYLVFLIADVPVHTSMLQGTRERLKSVSILTKLKLIGLLTCDHQRRI